MPGSSKMAKLLESTFAVCGFISLISVSFATVGTDCSDATVCDTPTEICDTTCKCAPGYADGDNDNACTDDDECSGVNGCHANAACTNTPGSFTCTCNTGYTGDGKTCTEYTCSPNPCGNSGTCEDANPGVTCTCVSGWNGYTCTDDINECDIPSNCQNGATCTNNDATYNCNCATGWSGNDCNTDVNECDKESNCLNGGTCTNSDGSYTCTCTDGWTGVTCSTDIDECTVETPCDNGGTCTDTDGSYSCACTEAWAGMDCDKESLGACTGTACPTGVTNGECVDNNCVCQEGYMKDGDNCVENASVSISKMSQSLLLIVCLMAFVFKGC